MSTVADQILEKRVRSRGDIETLRQAVSAAKFTGKSQVPAQPMRKKTEEPRLHQLISPEQRAPLGTRIRLIYVSPVR